MSKRSLTDFLFRCGYLTWIFANIFFVLSQFYLNFYSKRLLFIEGVAVLIVSEIFSSCVRTCPAMFFFLKFDLVFLLVFCFT